MIIIVSSALILFFAVRERDKVSPATLALAQCLTEKGVKMYGADWCPACQKQKALFGDAFGKINYVECDREPAKCSQEKIEKLPTWIFPNSERMVGVLSLEELSETSSCEQVEAKP